MTREGPCPICGDPMTGVYTRKDRHSTMTRTPGYAWCRKCKSVVSVEPREF